MLFTQDIPKRLEVTKNGNFQSAERERERERDIDIALWHTKLCFHVQIEHSTRMSHCC